MAKIITIEFKDGEPTIHPTGYAGRACKAATEPIEKALGLTDVSTRETEDARKSERKRMVTA